MILNILEKRCWYEEAERESGNALHMFSCVDKILAAISARIPLVVVVILLFSTFDSHTITRIGLTMLTTTIVMNRSPRVFLSELVCNWSKTFDWALYNDLIIGPFCWNGPFEVWYFKIIFDDWNKSQITKTELFQSQMLFIKTSKGPYCFVSIHCLPPIFYTSMKVELANKRCSCVVLK